MLIHDTVHRKENIYFHTSRYRVILYSFEKLDFCRNLSVIMAKVILYLRKINYEYFYFNVCGIADLKNIRETAEQCSATDIWQKFHCMSV